MQHNSTLKVVVIGDGSAGKTSLRSRYLHNAFRPAYVSTIGVDFETKTIEVKVPVPTYPPKKAKQSDNGTTLENGEAQASSSAQPMKFRDETIRITFSIWDTAGQERFSKLGSAFYRGSDAVIIAFDLSAKGALARTLNWYNDFCRLGDVGHEDERMNSREIKIAREQRERFCWVGVGCKGDLLQELSSPKKDDSLQEEEHWKGVSWAEARGWFDTMIPRRLPEGEEEKQRYPNNTIPVESKGEIALPYTLGRDVPARPEDVLSRPNKASTSSQSANGTMEGGVSLGRPTEAGPRPGTAPTPGKAEKNKQQQQQYSPRKSLQKSESKSRGLDEKRRSIRSIDVWQGDQIDSLGSSVDTTSSSYGTAPIRGANGVEGSHRSRYDSSLSLGGPPSVYFSIRGSTILGQSPTERSASSLTSSSGKTAIMRNASLNNQDTKTRKQSNLSESVTNDEDEGNHDTPSHWTDESSSKTIRGQEDKIEEPSNDSEDEGSGSFPFIPTIPSGDPIPFPTNDDLQDDEEVDNLLKRGTSLGSKSRSVSRSFSRKDSLAEEGQVGRKAKVIAEETQKLRLKEEDEQNDEGVNQRTTLYSARPSSISSTIKPDDDEVSNREDVDENMVNAGDSYRDQMMEQGFRLFFTSAKDGNGIDDVFEHIAKRVAIRWKLEEWEEQTEAERLGGRGKNGQVRTAPPTDEEVERERVKRAIKLSSGRGTGSCCS